MGHGTAVYAICTMNPLFLSRLLRHRFSPIVALLLVTLVLTYPTITTLTTHVIDRQDPLLNTWIMAWEAHVIPEHLFQLFVFETDSYPSFNYFFKYLYQTNIFFPLDNTLAFSEILLSTGLIVMPITRATDSPILSYNIAFLFAFFSTALGAYLLALYLTGNRGAALVAAVAFAWSPYRMGHLSQIQLLTFGWLPLAFIYVDRLLRGKGNSARNGILLGLFFVLQALASFYSALFGGIGLLLYGIGWLLWRRRLPVGSLIGFILAGLLVFLLVVPFTLPYFENQRELGAGWTLEDNERFSASLQAYGYAPEGTLFWDELTRPLAYTYGACCPPDSLFPGVTLVGLSAFALWKAKGGRRGLWLGIGIIAFLLSLGPTLTIAAGQPTEQALPYKWLYENVPLFNGLRAPVRWAVLVTLVLSILAAAGIARWRWRWGWMVAFGLVLAEFAVFPLRVVPLPEPPDSLAWLANQPPTRILEIPLVADLPRPDVEGEAWQEPRLAWEVSRLLEMQYFSTAHWHTTLDGYSGYVPARHGDYARELASLPGERAFLLLRGLGFDYVVVHEDELSEEARARWQQPLPDGVTEIERFEDERVFALEPYADGRYEKDADGIYQWITEPYNEQVLLPVSEMPAHSTVVLPLPVTTDTPLIPISGSNQTIRLGWKNETGITHYEDVSITYPVILDTVTVVPLTVNTPSSGQWSLFIGGSYPNGVYFEQEIAVTITDEPIIIPDYLPIALEQVEPVDATTYRLTWQTYQPLMHDYSISVRWVDGAGNVLAQQDGAPGSDVPTSAWLAGEPYTADFTLEPVPDDEEVQLVVIWYDPARPNGTRVWDGERFVEGLRIPYSK